MLLFCLSISTVDLITRKREGSPFITTGSDDNPDDFRYLGYNSNVSFSPCSAILSNKADYFSTFNGKNIYLNECSSMTKALPIYKQISVLLKMPMFKFETVLSKLPHHKKHPKTKALYTCKPDEYIRLEKRGKKILLGKYSHFTAKTNELAFHYTNGDLNGLGTRHSATIIFSPSKECKYKANFTAKPGQYKFTIGLPELNTVSRRITLNILKEEDVESMKAKMDQVEAANSVKPEEHLVSESDLAKIKNEAFMKTIQAQKNTDNAPKFNTIDQLFKMISEKQDKKKVENTKELEEKSKPEEKKEIERTVEKKEDAPVEEKPAESKEPEEINKPTEEEEEEPENTDQIDEDLNEDEDMENILDELFEEHDEL